MSGIALQSMWNVAYIECLSGKQIKEYPASGRVNFGKVIVTDKARGREAECAKTRVQELDKRIEGMPSRQHNNYTNGKPWAGHIVRLLDKEEEH